jgi:hypothetical protein
MLMKKAEMLLRVGMNLRYRSQSRADARKHAKQHQALVDLAADEVFDVEEE